MPEGLSSGSVDGTFAVLSGFHLSRDLPQAYREVDMKKILVLTALAFVATAAFAQTPPKAGKSEAKAPQMTAPAATPPSASNTCKTQAADKKLAGAAMTSFMKKCQADASKACETESKSQNLKGAAKNSHMKKCVSDAVGA